MTKQENQKSIQFVRYLGPILDALRRLGCSGTPDEVIECTAQDLCIPDDVQNELLPSGESFVRNQMELAIFYLIREELLCYSKHHVLSLTVRGRATYLAEEESRLICGRWAHIACEQLQEKANIRAPITRLVADDKCLVPDDYRAKAINLMFSLPSEGFERFSQRVLREAGFKQVIVTGRGGDGSINGHGILQINPLASLKILFQCKRYATSVSPSHVRDFRGELTGRADKGIIITAGIFSAEARREAFRDEGPLIELIDGEQLVDLLERFELGLKPTKMYEIDEAFFEEFRKR